MIFFCLYRCFRFFIRLSSFVDVVFLFLVYINYYFLFIQDIFIICLGQMCFWVFGQVIFLINIGKYM